MRSPFLRRNGLSDGRKDGFRSSIAHSVDLRPDDKPDSQRSIDRVGVWTVFGSICRTTPRVFRVELPVRAGLNTTRLFLQANIAHNPVAVPST